MVVAPPELLSVPLTREEVEAHYAQHIEKYSAPEVARVRHILVSPTSATPAADAEARSKAEDLLKRVRAGESFADLARQYSDDPATRESGGDVGVFGHGTMLDEFERVAFRMRPGDLQGPIKTEVGYHILELLEHARQEMTPLTYCYTNVAVDAAFQKSEAVSKQRADSLWRSFKTPAQAAAVAQRHGFMLIDNEHTLGEKVHTRDLADYFEKLETVKPGQIYPGIQLYKGMGYVITWVNRILPPKIPRWDEVRTAALDRYRNEAGLRAMEAKRAEMDSLEKAGWSLDSLAVLWGGFEHVPSSPAGASLPRLGGRELVDSLAFGGTRPPVLKVGDTSGWVELPAGRVRLRLLGRHEPDAIQLTKRVETERRIALERNLKLAFEKLKQRFPVRILDRELRATPLPELPES
jgi:peptidyl-prolyl cis-trans isomerase D